MVQPHGWLNGLRAAKKRGVKIIVVDARRTKTAEVADIHLQPRQGTDAALAAGVCRVLFEEGLYNKDFCDKWVHGVNEYREYCKQFTPEKTEELTGVPAQLVVDAARMYAQGPGSFALTSQSLSHSTNGVNNTRGWLCVPAILGYVDNPAERCSVSALKTTSAMTTVLPKNSWITSGSSLIRKIVWTKTLFRFGTTHRSCSIRTSCLNT